jgi:hypothetical protein
MFNHKKNSVLTIQKKICEKNAQKLVHFEFFLGVELPYFNNKFQQVARKNRAILQISTFLF